ncbi:MAG: NADH-quinone oxidoreductase subunit NuoF [Candidatus Eremiobacteraeota bacterium]|nr:NADH-quinone oxidoreductase subunit NuoF [Candidatus Eremiobacteraeota bacterium]
MSEPILLRRPLPEKPVALEEYLDGGGYAAFRKALTMEPSLIIDEVKRSGLRGRGGAAFPTGDKWGYVPRGSGKPVYLVCNADEGEPGTFKDRVLMESDPHLVIEGMLCAARAIGAERGFIYLRGEFARAARAIGEALEEARHAGILGHDKELPFDISIFRGAGSYICGDETALIESLEGKRGQPRMKPPYPVQAGLYGCPTVVNNVETLACIPFIIREGAGMFAAIGSGRSRGTKLFSVSGDVKRPGCYEYPMGTPLHTLINEGAGGIGEGMILKGVIPGGISTPVLLAAECDVTMDYESLEARGSSLGSGGVIVLGSGASIPGIALTAALFFRDESCGQCGPCREGTAMLARLLEETEAPPLQSIERLCTYMRGACLCPLGDAAALAIGTMARKFRSEFARRGFFPRE